MSQDSNGTSSIDLTPTRTLSRSKHRPDPSPVNSSSKPRLRRLKLQSTHSEAIKARPLQRKPAPKRKIATTKTVSPPSKRTQRQKDVSSLTSPSLARHDDNSIPSSARDFRSEEHELSPNAGTKSTEGHRQGVIPNEVANAPRVINSITPDTRTDNSTGAPAVAMLTRDDVVELLKASEQRTIKHLISQQRLLLSRINTMERVVQDLPAALSTVRCGVEKLKVMMLPSSIKTKTPQNNSRPQNSTKSKALKIEVVNANATLPAELTIVFNSDIACVATAKTIAAQVFKFHRNRESIGITSRLMNLILYSSKKEIGKAAMKERIGFRHAEFRFKIVRTMFELAKAIPDKAFDVDGAAQEDGNENEAGARVTHKPSWLTSESVDVNAFSLARKHHEWFASDLPKDPATPDKRKALYIAKQFFKVVVDMLRLSREKSKIKMFEDGVYTLLTWSELEWLSYPFPNPTLHFAWPKAEIICPSEVPDTVVGNVGEVMDVNSRLLESLISQRKEMVMRVRYHVTVSKGATAQARKRDEEKFPKIMTKIINILRMSRSFLCGFCHVGEEDLLRIHPSMLQCMYRFALVLRHLFISKIHGTTRSDAPQTSMVNRGMEENSQRNGTAVAISRETSDRNTSIPNNPSARGDGAGIEQEQNTRSDTQHGSDSRRRKDVSPIEVKSLLPAQSEMERIFKNLLNMSFEMYDKTNARGYGDDSHDRNASNAEEGELEADVSDSGDDGMSDMLSDDD